MVKCSSSSSRSSRWWIADSKINECLGGGWSVLFLDVSFWIVCCSDFLLVGQASHKRRSEVLSRLPSRSIARGRSLLTLLRSA